MNLPGADIGEGASDHAGSPGLCLGARMFPGAGVSGKPYRANIHFQGVDAAPPW
jgi:hypothetical protein